MKTKQRITNSIFAFLLIAATGTAYASCGAAGGPPSNGCDDNGDGGGNASVVNTNINTNTNTNRNFNTNRNMNTNVNRQAQRQGQSQSQGQEQGQSQSMNNTGNTGGSANVNVTTPKQPTSGPGIGSSPSATCRIAVGLSVGGTFGGIGGISSVEDERCADMERGRFLKEVLNRPDAAKRIACMDEKMADALGDCEPKVVAKAAAKREQVVKTEESAFTSGQ